MAEDKYRVSTEYSVEDRTSGAMGRITHAFERASHGIEGLNRRFAEFRQEQRFTAAAALGVGFGLGALVEKAKDANQEFEATKKSVTGLLSAMLEWPSGISAVDRYNRASKLSADVTEHLEETAARYGQQLPELAQGYKYLAAAMAPMHLSLEQQTDLTDKIAATAKTTGTDVNMAFMQMGRAIMFHGVRPVGVLGATLKNALDSEGKLGKMGGAAGAKNRLKLIEGVMRQQVPVADLMSQGIGDSLNRLRMEVDKVFRRLTGPVFKEIGHEIAGWSKKIEAMTKNGELERWSHAIVDAFHELQSISGFLVDHWKTLATIWATFKVGSMAGGLASGIGGMGGMLGSIGGSLGTFAAALGPVTLGLGALYLSISALVDFLDKRMDVQTKQGLAGMSVVGAAKSIDSVRSFEGPLPEHQIKALRDVFKDLYHQGVLGTGGDKLDRGAVAYKLKEMFSAGMGGEISKFLLSDPAVQRASRISSKAADEAMVDSLVNKIVPMMAAHPELLPGAKQALASTESDKNLKFKGATNLFTGPININQKFDDVDPDRVWVATKRGIEGEAERRTSSVYANPYGL